MTNRNPDTPPVRHHETPGTAPGDTGQIGDGPHWELRTDNYGNLVASLTGTYPPFTVTAPDLETLRKQIRTVIMRAML
jgi:hypothetical protein